MSASRPSESKFWLDRYFSHEHTGFKRKTRQTDALGGVADISAHPSVEGLFLYTTIGEECCKEPYKKPPSSKSFKPST